MLLFQKDNFPEIKLYAWADDTAQVRREVDHLFCFIVAIRYRWPNAKRNHISRSQHHEDKDHRSSREEVLRVDWRLDSSFPFNVPANVDFEAGVRRVWPLYRTSQVLLICRRARESKSRLNDSFRIDAFKTMLILIRVHVTVAMSLFELGLILDWAVFMVFVCISHTSFQLNKPTRRSALSGRTERLDQSLEMHPSFRMT